MEVKAVAVTKPLVRDDSGNLISVDEFIAYCAKVSNPAGQTQGLKGGKLIKYLIKNNHWSPFEMANMVMEVQTTRDIGRQILRHKSCKFQEYSQRYALASGFITNREARLQDNKNRQNSFKIENIELQEWFEAAQEEVVAVACSKYNQAIEKGIAKECARVFLPEGLTMSTMYINGDVRSWIHYCLLRISNGTQLEHMEIAKQCWNIIREYFPSIDNYYLLEGEQQ